MEDNLKNDDLNAQLLKAQLEKTQLETDELKRGWKGVFTKQLPTIISVVLSGLALFFTINLTRKTENA